MTWFILVLHCSVDVIEVIYYMHGPAEHARSQLYSSITTSKFDIEPILPVGHVTINFGTLAAKCVTTSPFWVFSGVLYPLNIVGSHSNRQMPHTLVTTCHFSDKCLNSMQRFDLGGLARKKL